MEDLAGIKARALTTRVMQRLAGPAEAIAGIQEIVVEELRKAGHAEALTDARKVQDAARELLAKVIQAGETGIGAAGNAEMRHDLRTPINAVIGYSELILEDFGDALPGAIQSDIRSVVGECALLLSQIEKVLGSDTDNFSGTEIDGLAAAALEQTLRFTPEEEAPEGGRILVIDDTAANRDLMRRQLERRGHAVTTAASAAEGFAALEKDGFDLLLVDILMPDMNGIEVLGLLKNHPDWHRIPVIMVSGLKEMRAVTRCIAAGAEDYIHKPIDPVLLHSRVASCLEKVRWQQKELRYVAQIEYERDRADALLHAMLPAQIIGRLRAGETVIADRFDEATIVFADIVDFTPLTVRVTPAELLKRLTDIFLAFDDAAERRGVEKIKTIGDAYMAASGVPEPVEDHAERAFAFARDVMGVMQGEAGAGLQVRIGVHSGPVIAGLIGRIRFVYDVWGNTVNLASRLEESGVPGRIHISAETRARLSHLDGITCDERQSVLKGLGSLKTYVVR
jgi:adenylate cyclase